MRYACSIADGPTLHPGHFPPELLRMPVRPPCPPAAAEP
jgi:hypothetical protein